MSYERTLLLQFKMPSQNEVENALLKSLFEHNGTIKEFSSGEYIVEELAVYFKLNKKQRNATLETVYLKENRIKRSSLWHRLLFRAADNLAKQGLVSRPTQTYHLTYTKEWMLTEKGYDVVLSLLHINSSAKESLNIKSYEVQKIVKKILNQPRPLNYKPFDSTLRKKTNREISLRNRSFRQAVIEAYEYKCAFCGMKLHSPARKTWEIEAAHIVPYSVNGKDDILNGVSLCRFHHWTFDVGWFSISDDFTILTSPSAHQISNTYGVFHDINVLKIFSQRKHQMFLPNDRNLYPHKNSLIWHRNNIFFST